MKKWYGAIIAFALIADRLSKQWAQKVLMHEPQGTIPIWENVFHLTYVENRGAAFGMLQGQRVLFLIVTVILTLALLWTLFVRKPSGRGVGIGMAMVLGGAWGNFYDRMVYQFVVDMLDFRLINFPVFNIADVMICVGVGVWILFYLLEDARAQKAAKEKEAQAEASASEDAL